MERKKVVDWWVDRLLVNYPVKPVFEVVSFLQEAAEKIVDGALSLYKGTKVDLSDAVDDVMRFLATDRNLSPADSIRFFCDLRDFMTEELNLKTEERLKFARTFEEIIFTAFNAYMACREKIFELRLKEKEADIEMMRKIMDYASKSLSSRD
uniref:RsbT co-antagonist protein RsbRD N-terminal domain-containing protein n=1 Tax=Archaeoglobus fulgidus TaxID=2234 RepID=A0A7C3RHP1_ARCFL